MEDEYVNENINNEEEASIIEEVSSAQAEELALENKKSFKMPENKYLRAILTALIWIKNFWLSIWKSKLKAFILLCVLLVGILTFVIIYTAYYGSFLNMNSDDILQYYPYVANFFDKIKNGELSLYDVNLFGGTSFFSGIYYIPLDIFTFIAFILSFFMQGEIAYAITNFLRPACGALVLFYAFSRKFNLKVAFISGLILFVGGMTEAYYIFPVYLGICFYAPLGMLLVDICIEKKGKWYLLVPLYSLIVIFYDFYMAYMILAFICFYFLIIMFTENHVSIIGKNTIIKNKEFWKRALEFYGLLILGVLMSAAILLPSALYISNESSRVSGSIDENLLYFSKWSSEEKKYVFSLRHYFTQWCNLFIGNEPHRFCLNDAGDYIREHASLYITSGGLIYLAYFFFLKDKRSNRLKIWVLLFNILLLIPAISMFFTFSTEAYIRWFFMPYLLNLYAAALAMNENDFKIGNNNFLKLVPAILLTMGLVTLIYVITCAPAEFIHYEADDEFFYPILIPAIIFIGIYLALLIIDFIISCFKKNPWLLKKTIPVIIFMECICAGIYIFANVDNSSHYYYNSKNQCVSYKNNITSYYDYNYSNGYRINLYSAYGLNTVNNNIKIGNVNFGRFFQSFYSTALNNCLNNVYDLTSTSISRTFNDGYTLLSSPIWNVKYIASNNPIYLPEKYYNLYTDENDANNVKYYELKDSVPFIVYENGFTDIKSAATSLSSLEKRSLLLYSAYIQSEEDDNSIQDRLTELGFEFTTSGAVINEKISSYIKYFSIRAEEYRYSDYMYYDLSDFDKTKLKDAVYAYVSSSDLRKQTEYYMYFGKMKDVTIEDGSISGDWENCYQFHYDNFYLDAGEFDYDCLLIKNSSNSINYSVKLYTYEYELYDNFILEQAQYTDKYFYLDGDKMYIKCVMPDDSKTRIIKTGYAYSADWKIYNEGYETVNVDGGFLGIVVPKGVDNVDISVSFEPAGYSTGLKITALGCIIYLAITTPVITVSIIKRKKRSNDQ